MCSDLCEFGLVIFVFQKVTLVSNTRDLVPLTLQQPPLPELLHHLLQRQDLAAVQVRNLWGVVLTWFGAMFYVLCTIFSSDYLSAGCLT